MIDTKNRILLKISGESLMGESNYGLNVATTKFIAQEIKNIYNNGTEICLIIGGGNIYRGIKGAAEGIDRSTSDYMGMLATVMNALSMQSILETLNVPTRVQSAINMSQIAEPYIRRKAIRHLEKKRIVIFAAGTGNPFFTTDTAASLRASEMNCNIIIKATKVDGIYSKDPNVNPDAEFYKNISYSEVLNNELRVMDSTAISLAKESRIPILITNINRKNSILEAINGIGKFSKIS
jgi:uridylate kinase